MNCRYTLCMLLLSVFMISCGDVVVPENVKSDTSDDTSEDTGNVTPDEGAETVTTECTFDSDCTDLEPGVCQAVACEEGTCAVVNTANGEACDDGDACTVETICDEGECRGGESVCDCIEDADCVDLNDACLGSYICGEDEVGVRKCTLDEATVITCDTSGDDACNGTVCEAGECVVQHLEGASCDDNDGCTQVDTCDAGGACVGSDPVVCDTSADSECSVTTCISATGNCTPSYLTGTACDDGESCTLNDICSGTGECVGDSLEDFESCDGSHFCLSGTCLSSTDAQFNPVTCTQEVPDCCPNSQEAVSFTGLYESGGNVFAVQSFLNTSSLFGCPSDCDIKSDWVSVCAVDSGGDSQLAGYALIQKANRVRGNSVIGQTTEPYDGVLYAEIDGGDVVVDFSPQINQAVRDSTGYGMIQLHDVAYHSTVVGGGSMVYRLLGGWQVQENTPFNFVNPYLALCSKPFLGQDWTCTENWDHNHQGVIKGVDLYAASNNKIGAWIVSQDPSSMDFRISHTADIQGTPFISYYTEDSTPLLNGVVEIGYDGILAYGNSGFLVACVPPADGGVGYCTSVSAFPNQAGINFWDGDDYSGGTVLIIQETLDVFSSQYRLAYTPVDTTPIGMSNEGSWRIWTIGGGSAFGSTFLPTRVLMSNESVTIGGVQSGAFIGAPWNPKVRMYR